MPIPGYFRLHPSELATIKAADLNQLAKVVARLPLADSVGPPRPIKLWLPEPMQKVLDQAAALGYKKKDLILRAAREFRVQFPVSKRLLNRELDMDNSAKRGRKCKVLQLSPADRQLIEGLGVGNAKIGNRHDALVEMTRIMREWKLPKVVREKRTTTYLPIPEALAEALEDRHQATGIGKVEILLRAIEAQKSK